MSPDKAVNLIATVIVGGGYWQIGPPDRRPDPPETAD